MLYFGGWLLLPVANYPRETMTASYFTVEVIGAGLPSNLGLTKAVVVPLATLVAWLFVRVRRVRWAEVTALDAVMAAFCLWPLAGSVIRGGGAAAASHDALYLLASWGASWALARGLFRWPDDWDILLRGAAWSGVALLPVALVEGVAGPKFYTVAWGRHAFLLEGAARTVGYRPLGFFEHGNQYAIWLACAALAWLALAKLDVLKPKQWLFAAATIAALVASQSIGAIALLIAGGVVMWIPSRLLRRGVIMGGGGVALLGAAYISGIVPAERIGRSAMFAPQAIAPFAPLRIKSILYRIRRDQMAIPVLRKAPIAGTAQWDWWRPLGSHPWGLPLLLAGQFGGVPVILLLVALLTSPLAVLLRTDKRGIVCATLVLVAAADALFNSFVYFPAVLFAAGLVGNGGRIDFRSRSNAVDNCGRALSMPRRNP